MATSERPGQRADRLADEAVVTIGATASAGEGRARTQPAKSRDRDRSVAWRNQPHRARPGSGCAASLVDPDRGGGGPGSAGSLLSRRRRDPRRRSRPTPRSVSEGASSESPLANRGSASDPWRPSVLGRAGGRRQLAHRDRGRDGHRRHTSARTETDAEAPRRRDRQCDLARRRHPEEQSGARVGSGCILRPADAHSDHPRSAARGRRSRWQRHRDHLTAGSSRRIVWASASTSARTPSGSTHCGSVWPKSRFETIGQVGPAELLGDDADDQLVEPRLRLVRVAPRPPDEQPRDPVEHALHPVVPEPVAHGFGRRRVLRGLDEEEAAVPERRRRPEPRPLQHLEDLAAAAEQPPGRPPRTLQPAPPVVRPQLPDRARVRRVAPIAVPVDPRRERPVLVRRRRLEQERTT